MADKGDNQDYGVLVAKYGGWNFEDHAYEELSRSEQFRRLEHAVGKGPVIEMVEYEASQSFRNELVNGDSSVASVVHDIVSRIREHMRTDPEVLDAISRSKDADVGRDPASPDYDAFLDRFSGWSFMDHAYESLSGNEKFRRLEAAIGRDGVMDELEYEAGQFFRNETVTSETSLGAIVGDIVSSFTKSLDGREGV